MVKQHSWRPVLWPHQKPLTWCTLTVWNCVTSFGVSPVTGRWWIHRRVITTNSGFPEASKCTVLVQWTFIKNNSRELESRNQASSMVKSEDGNLPQFLVRLESQLVCKKNGALCWDLELPKLHFTRSCVFFSSFAFGRRALTHIPKRNAMRNNRRTHLASLANLYCSADSSNSMQRGHTL